MKSAVREADLRPYQFGPFRLVAGQRLLTRDGRPVDVSPKALDLLLILVERAGEVVSKDDLMQQLWPGIFVEENNLAKAVSSLRQALAGGSDSPEYVKTIPRRGYTFIHSIRQARESDPPGPEEVVTTPTSIPAIAPGELRGNQRRFVSIALSLLCTVALIYFFAIWYPHSRPAAKKTDSSASVLAHVVPRRSIAVVGIRNASAHPRDAWLSTALAEMLTTELADGSKLRVLSQESVARLKSDLAISDVKAFNAEQLSRLHTTLGADLVVSGTYVVVGDKEDLIRVDLRVQDPVSGEEVASIAESGRPTDLFEIVSHAGARLRDKLQLQQVSRDEAENVKASMPSSPEAARLYTQGLVRMRAFDVLAARDLFEKAVAADPQFASGHSRLAGAWSQLGYDDRAKEEAKRAFDLSGSLSQEQRLWVEGNYREMAKDWDLAIEIYRRLWGFYPDDPEYGLQLASVQTSAYRQQDALVTVDNLRRLPLSAGDRARVDLAEATASDNHDQKRELEAARKARAEGESQDERLLVARATLFESYAYGDSGRAKDALCTAAEAQRFFAAVGDRVGYARALIYEANVLRTGVGGNLTKRKQLYEEALSVCRLIGNKRCEAGALNNMGGVLADWGDLPGAKKRYEESLAVRLAVNDKSGMATALNNIGTVLQAYDPAGARKAYEQALKIYRGIGAKAEEGMALGNIAEIVELQGDLAQAKNTMQESLRVWQEVGGKSIYAAGAFSEMGNLLFLAGDLDGAERFYLESISMAASLGAPNTSAETRVRLAGVWIEKKRLAEAEKAVREGREMFRREKQIDAEALTDTLLLKILLRGSRLQEARAEANGAARLVFHTGGTAENFPLAIMLAEVQAAAGNVLGATKSLRQILDATVKLGIVEYALQARLTLGKIEMKSGKPNGRAGLKELFVESQRRGFGMIAQEAERELQRPADVQSSAPTK